MGRRELGSRKKRERSSSGWTGEIREPVRPHRPAEGNGARPTGFFIFPIPNTDTFACRVEMLQTANQAG